MKVMLESCSGTIHIEWFASKKPTFFQDYFPGIEPKYCTYG